MRTLVAVTLLAVSVGAQELADRLRKHMTQAVADGQAPGVVCLVDRVDGDPVRVVVGARSTVPAHEPMSMDSVFDCASLTKVVATTTCVMQLVDAGQLALNDRVAKHLPGFGANGKDVITIEQLLRHRGGLLPDNALEDYRHGPAEARRRIYALGLRAPPGTRTIYTDVGFIVLGWVVEKLTGQTLDARARDAVFEPCGMRDTRFVRAGSKVEPKWLLRCAPTEPATSGGEPLRGVVHDPRARLLDGVAGHAGLFSTAEDLARFGRMILRGGLAADGTLILKPETVRLLTSRAPSPSRADRALGWRLSPVGTWHTGFTGTAMWMDRFGTVTVLLASRLHPDGKGNVRRLRRIVALIVGSGPRTVKTGIDVVESAGWPEKLRGLRVGLVTNHTGRTKTGRSTIDVLHTSSDVKLAALFSPEHGIRGALDRVVDDDLDEKTGLKIHSLYGESRRPSAAALRGLDALVFDIQDIGTRFYTYVSTMVNCMEEAARHGLKFVVLDRPNPIGGVQVEGPIADADSLDFVGRLRIPIRHGMTVGELASLARAELKRELDLHVVACKGWRREWHLDECSLPWVNPSPNMRSLDAALLYPGIGILETTNLSVGRGTGTPFELMGAPWIDGPGLARALRAAGLAGVDVQPVAFTPDASKFKGQRCSGVRFMITDREALRPVRLGITLASILVHRHASAWDTRRLPRLLKHRKTLDALIARRAFAAIEASWRTEHQRFLDRRIIYLMYPPPSPRK